MRIALFLVGLLSISSLCVAEPTKRILLAVGHDHARMVTANYPIYRANWEFINESLALLGYEVQPKILPWARAKLYTQEAKVHGLFLAADLAGREKWALLSAPLGYGVFGGFYHRNNANRKDLIGSVRVGDHDRILAQYNPTELLEVATAQEGFRLLSLQKIDRLIMSESYGLFLLNTELEEYRSFIDFDEQNIERHSIHIAFSKDFPSSLQAMNIVNEAIRLGIDRGLYNKAMGRNEVPMRMRLTEYPKQPQ